MTAQCCHVMSSCPLRAPGTAISYREAAVSYREAYLLGDAAAVMCSRSSQGKECTCDRKRGTASDTTEGLHQALIISCSDSSREPRIVCVSGVRSMVVGV